MTEYLKVVSGVLISVVLGICLSKQAKDWSLMLTVAVCCMVMAAASVFLEPILNFVEKIQGAVKLDTDILKIFIKAVGAGLIGEFAGLICQDSGYSSLSKAIQILTIALILWLSLPMMESFLDMVEGLLEGV